MSNKKNILIRIDSSSTIGLGHLMRTLLLANGLKNHFHITYITQDLAGNQNHLIKQNGFTRLHVKCPLGISNMDCIEFLAIIAEIKPALCIIDHYGIDSSCEQKVKALCPLLVFDDEFKNHCADMVLNHSFIAKKEDYNYLKETKILAGSEYTLLKDAFLSHKNRFTPLGNLKQKKILITLGGSDPLGLSLPIKKALLKLEKSLHVSIVTSSANAKLSYLKALDKELVIDEKNMATLMQNYDLIITSASTSLLETFALNKPFIAIQCASNQSQSVDVLKSLGLGNVIGDFSLAALKKALNFVQYRPHKLKYVLSRYKFQKDGVAREIIREYQ